jgi:serine/threonine-protein kinase
MAPEQAMARTVTPATDVYALGAVAYHCLTGSPPFPGDNPVQVALRHVQDPAPPLPPDVPPSVQALVATALAKNPADRYATAGHLAVAVDAARTDPGSRPVGTGIAGSTQVIGPRTRVLTAGPTAAGGTAAMRVGAPAATGAGAGWGAAVHRRRFAAAGVLLGTLLAALVWLGLRDGDPASPSDNQPPVAPTSPSTRDSTGGGAPPPTSAEPTTRTTTRPGGPAPTTAPPEPTTEPTATPDTSSEPVEPPPPTSEPAVSP